MRCELFVLTIGIFFQEQCYHTLHGILLVKIICVHRNRLLIVPASFPVMAPSQPSFMPGQLQIQGQAPISTTIITNIDLMARKALQEEMPGIILRGIIRSSSKAIAQYQASKNDQTGLAALAVALGSIVTESADERTWRSLPAQIAIARARIPSGEHTLGFGASPGGRDLRFSVHGRYAVVGLRFLGGSTFATEPTGGAAGKPGPQAARRREPSTAMALEAF